jgi:hypothetical protein
MRQISRSLPKLARLLVCCTKEMRLSFERDSLLLLVSQRVLTVSEKSDLETSSPHENIPTPTTCHHSKRPRAQQHVRTPTGITGPRELDLDSIITITTWTNIRRRAAPRT